MTNDEGVRQYNEADRMASALASLPTMSRQRHPYDHRLFPNCHLFPPMPFQPHSHPHVGFFPAPLPPPIRPSNAAHGTDMNNAHHFSSRPPTADSMMSSDSSASSDSAMAKLREENAALREEIDRMKHEVLDLKVQKEMDATEKRAVDQRIELMSAKLAERSETIEFLEMKCKYFEDIYNSIKARIVVVDAQVADLTEQLRARDAECSSALATPSTSSETPSTVSGFASDAIDSTVDASPSSLACCPTSSEPGSVTTSEEAAEEADATVNAETCRLRIDEAIDETVTPKTFDQILKQWTARKDEFDILRGIDVAQYLFNPDGPRTAPQKVRKVSNAFTLFTGNRLSLSKSTGLKLSNHSETWTLLDAEEKQDWRAKWLKLTAVQNQQVALGFIEVCKDPKKRTKGASVTPSSSSSSKKKCRVSSEDTTEHVE